MTTTDFLDLVHWRRKTAAMYTAVRQAHDPSAAWQQFVIARSHLFKTHPQSPLTIDQRAAFQAISYYPYNPALRVTGEIDDDEEATERIIELPHDGLFRYKRIARVYFNLNEQTAQLSLFWVQGYGGGIFLPFKDATNKTETFGGGRYLYDTIKGADLGLKPHEMMLDFNFAYNPSCAYNSQWVCPLSPPENFLKQAITAGERKFSSGDSLYSPGM